jgi:hypothetical protein
VLGILCGWIIPFSAAYWLVDALLFADSGRPRTWAERVAAASLSLPLMNGFLSLVYFGWWFMAGRPVDFLLVSAELAIAVVAVVLGVVYRELAPIRRTGETLPPDEPPPLPFGPLPWISRAALLFCLATALATSIAHYCSTPLGDRDAWSIWTFRARYLSHPGVWDRAWTQALQRPFAHPDYPWLVPATTARVWHALQWGEHWLPEWLQLPSDAHPFTVSPLWVPWLNGVLTLLASVGLLWSLVRILNGRLAAVIAAVILLCTSRYVRLASVQYADVPLSLYFLAAIGVYMLGRGGRVPERTAMVIAGLSAGFAAWTKNEGLLFLGVFCLCAFLDSWRRPVMLARLCIGMLIPMIAVVPFKALLPTTNDLVAGQGFAATVSRLTDASRYVHLAVAGPWHAWTAAKFLWIAIPVVVWLLGPRASRPEGWRLAAVVPSLVAAGYAAVYLVTPHDLKWHLDTSCSRLVLQLWPCLLLVVFTATNSPEEIVPGDSLRR